MAVLIPCDGIAVAVADTDGVLLDAVALPRSGPGADHVVADGVVVNFHNGPDLTVRLVMERRDEPFTGRDLALLRLLEPVCRRLFSERPAPHLPARLTIQERRVLGLVAAGRSNAQIAERLTIAPSTVRKHLEHIYPKLGVTNRLAAAVVFEGRTLPDPERVTAVQRYA